VGYKFFTHPILSTDQAFEHHSNLCIYQSIIGSSILSGVEEYHSGNTDILHSQQYIQHHRHQTNHPTIPGIMMHQHPQSSPFISKNNLGVQNSQQSIGEVLVRPHSATPSFDSGSSVGLPPGFTNRQETPPHSNQSGEANIFLDDPYMDRSQIFELGQRRPASTGVIGDNQSQSSSTVLSSLGLGTDISGKSGRPAAKTLMDLIQEDYPGESNLINSSTLCDNSTPLFKSDQILPVYPLERPRTTSPLQTHYMRRENHDGNHMNGDLYSSQRSIEQSQRMNNNADLSDPMSRLGLGLVGETSYHTSNKMVSR